MSLHYIKQVLTTLLPVWGTALTTEQAHLIARYTKEVVIAYDADEAGQKQRLVPYSCSEVWDCL